MKRNFYYFILVLFILAACQPSPVGQGQAATATQEEIEKPEPQFIVNNKDLQPYPQTSESFIIEDPRTMGEIEKTIEDIKNSPTAGYSQILDMYYQKLIELGFENTTDHIPYISTNPQGDGWTMTIMHGDQIMYIPTTKTGIPHQDLIISPSAPLDSFDLILITRTAGLKIIWDKSGWPILATKDNKQWYQAGYNPVGWKDFDNLPEPTVESKNKKFIINTKHPDYPVGRFPEASLLAQYSEVNLEDFLSGEILKQEKEYVEKNKDKIFSDKAIPATKPTTRTETERTIDDTFSVTVKTIDFTPHPDEWDYDPETRPIKFLSYYKFYDEKVFEEMGIEEVANYLNEKYKNGTTKEYLLEEDRTRNPAFWIVSWAYLNPDRSIGIGHSFLDMTRLNQDIEYIKKSRNSDFQFLPGLEHVELTRYEKDLDMDFYVTHVFLEDLYQKYPELKPLSSDTDKWVNTGQMPEELEKVLFTYQAHLEAW